MVLDGSGCDSTDDDFFIELAYDDSIKWDSADEFVETVAKKSGPTRNLNLPENSDGSGFQRNCARALP
jgi:hypothetical protein